MSGARNEYRPHLSISSQTGVITPPDQAGPRPNGPGKEVMLMSDSVALILAIALMIAVIRGVT